MFSDGTRVEDTCKAMRRWILPMATTLVPLRLAVAFVFARDIRDRSAFCLSGAKKVTSTFVAPPSTRPSAHARSRGRASGGSGVVARDVAIAMAVILKSPGAGVVLQRRGGFNGGE